MNIGDKVRLLHSKESGVVVAVKGKIIEVAIEDGFTIPVAKNEIVLIAPEEKRLKGNDSPATQKPESQEMQALQGMFICFLPINEQRLALYLVNNTDFELPFSLSKDDGHTQVGLVAGLLPAKSQLMAEEWTLANFEHWPALVFQALPFRKGRAPIQAPLVKKMRFKASNFAKSKQKAPILQKEAYTFQIDREEAAQVLKAEEVQLNPALLAEKMFEKNEPEIPKPQVIQSLALQTATIDLHIEQLMAQHQHLNAAQILAYQMEHFHDALDKAIVQGKDEVTFIHGVGNGTLRQEIHRVLSKHPHVAYFRDAQKEKFGYGATLARLK